jgi:ParE toxin of type II toxin-antitoxin system, parDE
MAEYRLSPAAERDLEGIWSYTNREWGQAQADLYIDCSLPYSNCWHNRRELPQLATIFVAATAAESLSGT